MNRYLRMKRDAVLIVVLEINHYSGYVCVDGVPDFNLVFHWANNDEPRTPPDRLHAKRAPKPATSGDSSKQITGLLGRSESTFKTVTRK